MVGFYSIVDEVLVIEGVFEVHINAAELNVQNCYDIVQLTAILLDNCACCAAELLPVFCTLAVVR